MYVATFMRQWDRLYDMAVKGMSGDDGEGGWEGKDGRLYLDVLPCKLPVPSRLHFGTMLIMGT